MITRSFNRAAKLLSLFVFTSLLILGLAFVTTADASAHGGGQDLPFNLPACTSRIVVCDQSTIAAAPINSEAVREFNIQNAPQIQATPTPGVVGEPNRQHCLDGNGVPRSCDAVEPFAYHGDLKRLTIKPATVVQNLQPMAETPCTNGFAGEYPCSNVDLLSFLPLSNIGGGEGNDIWGWTDPLTNKEYVLMGRTNGTAFVDISNPTNPIYLGNLPSQNGRSSIWRDIKVYKNHAYIVADRSNGHGLQVFDLTELRGLSGRARIFRATAVYSNSGSAHNIAINEESGFAYIVGTSDGAPCSGGLHMVDIRIPTNPTFAGCFSDDGYTHDTQCVNYKGPDPTYQGREVCFSSNEDTLTIADVTQKTNVDQIARTAYNNARYSHQGWLTEDHAYFIQNDELDEINVGNNTRTIIWDVRNLEDPQYMGEFTFPFKTIDHNLYVQGNLIFEANYASGLRILDASNISNGTLTEVGYFDTYPAANDTSSVSAWSSYPYFRNNVVAVSTITEGLFILRSNVDSANTPPVLTNPGNQTSIVGQTVTLQLNASDDDQDTLTYSASNLPDNLTINPNTGQISGDPTTVQTKDVAISVDDGAGNTDSQNFTWTIKDELLLGDANCSTNVDATDAMVIMQYNVELRSDNGDCPLSDTVNQIYAAAGDVNSDNNVNVLDALFVMQCTVGISNSFCNELNAAHYVENSQVENSQATEPVAILLTQNSHVTTLQIDAASENVAAGSFTLNYDSDTAELVSCTPTANAVCHEAAPGIVRIIFADANGFSDATTIADLTFGSDDVTINELQVTSLVTSTSQDRTYTINHVQNIQEQQNYQLFVPLINR